MIFAALSSLIVHGGAATLGVMLVAPTQVPQQTVPNSSLSLAAMLVPQSEASATSPDARRLRSDKKLADYGPSLSAREAVHTAQTAAKTPQPPSIVKSTASPTVKLTEVKVTPTTQASRAIVHTLQSALSPEARVVPIAEPNKPSIASSPLAARNQTAIDLTSNIIPTTAPARRQSFAKPPASKRVAAAFDWSGATAFDPASLETIAAFLQPASSTGQNMRDSLAAALKAPSCARVQTAFDPATGSLAIRGHLRDEAQRAPLLAALSDQLGDSLPLKDQLLILPPPQCAILTSLDQLDLPQSEEQFTDPMLVGASSQVQTYNFVAGQRLILDLEAPDYPAFVYLDYFDANGDVIHLVPSTQRPLKAYEPATLFSIGRPDPVTGAPPALVLEIAAPFGQDIAVAYAASHPLYDGFRPFIEPAEAYLAFLQDQISLVRNTRENFRGEWAYLFVATRQN
ncbi:hypothetical protein [uncultured Shimia sp.]|uniref:hypothetical protein n=1 Tax=uncultured Shimia sp. TaxID=573152 RepID=UPI00263207D7|nr:hypothetical protein [uncultured Shimia sp.]